MSRTPREVFLALVNGVAKGRSEELPQLYSEQTHVSHPFDPHRAPALRTRDALREHFRPRDGVPMLRRRVDNVVIHETTDPEVIVAEFSYVGIDEPWELPGVFVMRIRDGEIVSSRDYFDHATAAKIREQAATAREQEATAREHTTTAREQAAAAREHTTTIREQSA